MGIGRSEKPIIGGRKFGSLLHKLGMDIYCMACVAYNRYTGARLIDEYTLYIVYSAACEGMVAAGLYGVIRRVINGRFRRVLILCWMPFHLLMVLLFDLPGTLLDATIAT